MESKYKMINYVQAKQKNKRIYIFVMKKEDELDPVIIIKTKTLIDFKKRIVSTTANSYSSETFKLLTDLSVFVKESHEYKKLINPVSSKHRIFDVNTDLDID